MAPEPSLHNGGDLNVSDQAAPEALRQACINGDRDSVVSLLDNGANPNVWDADGWYPIEHAAYRGHIAVVRLLEGRTDPTDGQSLDALRGHPVTQTDAGIETHVPWLRGEKESSDQSLWISLGSNDAGTSVTPVDCNFEADATYSLRVYTDCKKAQSYQLPLPGKNPAINKYFYFFAHDLEEATLVWELRMHTGQEERLVGTGIQVLGQLRAGIGSLRENLVRDTTIPIASGTTTIAKLTFSYLWVTPHPPPASIAQPHGWTFGNGVGGHRGSGKNHINDKKLQIGENTIQSFMTAIEHGASFLEFDVQLTRDLVPVIYHDFLVSETGTDAPMHTLTFEQFEYLSQSQGPRRAPHSRSNSLESPKREDIQVFSDRMSKTHFNKINGFKSNTRGNFIHEKSTTLGDMLRQLPKDVNMNIEIKYPMLWEADEWDMAPIAIKTDIYVDTILDKLYEFAGDRKIVFSSFSPEICIALSTKQRIWPVFFLSKTYAPRRDVRSSCIEQAIHFAKSWGLPGIVVECTPLVKCPRLIKYIQSAGLAVMSFGALNSNTECAKIQFDGGIDAIISDSVKAISRISNLPATESAAEQKCIFP